MTPSARGSGKPHRHVLRTSRGRAFGVEGCPGAVEPPALPGFTVEDHEGVLCGVRAHCADRGAAA